MPTEADSCRVFVLPRLYEAGWKDQQIAEQRTFTDGRILVAGQQARRGKPKRADYLLYYQPSYPPAVVEAKAAYRSPTDGMQQAKEYAQTLGLLFGYSTNGTGIVEYDFATGLERAVTAFPRPAELGALLPSCWNGRFRGSCRRWGRRGGGMWAGGREPAVQTAPGWRAATKSAQGGLG